MPPASDGTHFYEVAIQRDAYAAYRHEGLRGAHHIHLNRYFNLVESFPGEEQASRPFPIRTFDVRPYYEKGVTSHNWLFVAATTGMIRRITTVLPEPVYRERIADMASDPMFTVRKDRVTAYSRDLPWEIVTLQKLPVIDGPVVVTVDAGFFGYADSPEHVARMLRQKCPDIRMITLVPSDDEAEVTDEMRQSLYAFGTLMEGGS